MNGTCFVLLEMNSFRIAGCRVPNVDSPAHQMFTLESKVNLIFCHKKNRSIVLMEGEEERINFNLQPSGKLFFIKE